MTVIPPGFDMGECVVRLRTEPVLSGNFEFVSGLVMESGSSLA